MTRRIEILRDVSSDLNAIQLKKNLFSEFNKRNIPANCPSPHKFCPESNFIFPVVHIDFQMINLSFHSPSKLSLVQQVIDPSGFRRCITLATILFCLVVGLLLLVASTVTILHISLFFC